MSNRLEERLRKIDKVSPINNDRELALALQTIINEESSRLSNENIDMVSEATELLMSIRGIDGSEADQISSRLLSSFLDEVKSNEHKSSRKAVKPGFKFTAMRKVAMFAVLTFSAAALLITFNGSVRAAVKNTFVTWMRELAIIDFSEEEAVPTEKETLLDELSDSVSLDIENIPAGYTFDSKKEDGDSTLYTYKKGDDFVVIELIPTDPAGVIHSTENHKYSEIVIGKSEVYMFYNESERTGSIIFGNSEVTVIIGGAAERETLIAFAEEMIN